jgi:hypothetical protein
MLESRSLSSTESGTQRMISRTSRSRIAGSSGVRLRKRFVRKLDLTGPNAMSKQLSMTSSMKRRRMERSRSRIRLD